VDGIWEEADESMIRDKVSNTFRSVRAVMQKEGRIGCSSSSLLANNNNKQMNHPEDDDGAKKRSRQK
jgi:hypothetical protein